MNKRKTRSFLTIFSILVGITTIFIFVSFGYGLFSFIDNITSSSSVDKIIIQAKGAGAPGLDDTFKLTDDDLDVVKKSSGVIEASGLSFKSVEVKSKKEKKFVFLISLNPSEKWIMDVFSVDIKKGRGLRSNDKKQVVLGYNYMVPNKIFKKELDINDKININGVDFRIVGFYNGVGNPQDDSNIYMNIDYYKDFFNKDISYGWIIGRVDLNNIEKTIENVEKDLRKKRGMEKGKEDFFVQSYNDLISTYTNILNIIIAFIILIALISVFVSAINTANTMITSVLERYKEIGILKAVGAKNSTIRGIFLFESSFLGFIGGILGVGIGYILSYSGGVILDNLGWGFLKPEFSYYTIFGCIIFATLTGAISGVLPAIRASKINPIEALRYE